MELNAEPSPQEMRKLVEIGLALGVSRMKGEDELVPIKIAYNPYVTNQEAYSLLQAVSQVWQKLIFKASCNRQLIERVYSGIKDSDAMVSHLMHIRSLKNTTNEDGLIFSRTDYFVDEEGQPKIIEYNLTSVSMTAHTENFQQAKRLSDPVNAHKYFQNQPNKHFASQIHGLFQRKQLKGNLLMVVSPTESNIIEQRLLEIQLIKLGIKVTRITFFDALTQLTLDQHGNLELHDEQISVVYYRAGYQLSDYQQDPEAAWKARELIELSNAIKIPDITFDLMNQKRMQAELSKESVYSQYLSPEEAALLKRSLVPIWEFDLMSEQEFSQLLKVINQSGKGYILKPNLEGGGHNIHGEEVKLRLKEMERQERMKYILMEKIITKPIENILMHGTAQSIKVECTYEISQYGTIAIEDKQLLKSDSCGFLIRAKPASANEGGVLVGIGSICSWMIEGSQ